MNIENNSTETNGFLQYVLLFRILANDADFFSWVYVLCHACSIPSNSDNGHWAPDTWWPLNVAGVLPAPQPIYPTEHVANQTNHAEAVHSTDCEPHFIPNIFYEVVEGFAGWSTLVMSCYWGKWLLSWHKIFRFDNGNYPRHDAFKMA